MKQPVFHGGQVERFTKSKDLFLFGLPDQVTVGLSRDGTLFSQPMTQRDCDPGHLGSQFT